jgi:5-methylcytosine-specific restriction endonuclease McrA
MTATAIGKIREIYREYARLYNLAFPEVLQAYNRRAAVRKRDWLRAKRANNPVWAKENNFCYNSKRDPELTRRAACRWAKNNPEKACALVARRRAHKKAAAQGDSFEIAKVYARCRKLRRWFNVVVDHIIPLSKGGAHSPCNMQIIYASENSKKRDRLDYAPSVVFL